MIRLQREDFSVDEILQSLRQVGVGAVVTFIGIVRNESRDGKPVDRVDWDVYESMAYSILEEIRADAVVRFGLRNAAIVHRYGRQAPGDNLILIAVASPHRKEAFRACEYILDEIKKKAPLWKKEILSDGEERWIQG